MDRQLAQYLRSRLETRTPTAAKRAASLTEPLSAPTGNVVPLRRLSLAERVHAHAVPLVDLRFAAGAFGDIQSLEGGADDWVAVPDWVKLQPGLFVAQVIGESMNRRIPNGAWCLFRANPEGTRNGKVVVAQHRAIHDPELGGTYTIKVYSSSKLVAPDGSWRHTEIRLQPDSDTPGFEPILIRAPLDSEFRIVAEFLAVLD